MPEIQLVKSAIPVARANQHKAQQWTIMDLYGANALNSFHAERNEHHDHTVTLHTRVIDMPQWPFLRDRVPILTPS